MAGHPIECFVDFDYAKYNDYICGLCLDVLNEPLQCRSGHLFCRLCILNSLKSTAKSCPTCRCFLTRSLLHKNIVASNMVNDLLAHCGKKRTKFQCCWNGRFTDRIDHLCVSKKVDHFLIGKRIFKYFIGHGVFKGVVVAYDGQEFLLSYIWPQSLVPLNSGSYFGLNTTTKIARKWMKLT